MRAVQLAGHGGYDKLHYRTDVQTPRPSRGDVLIRVSAAAVNNTDINLRSGWYSEHQNSDSTSGISVPTTGIWKGSDVLRFPRIQGADVCGYIVGVGDGVSPDRIGERVIIDPILRSPPGYFGSDRDGGFAEYTTAPSANARRVVSNLTDVELASFPCSYSTAVNLLTRAGVERGDRVLVTGASGGVGSAVVQLAKLRGAYVIAVASEAKAARITAVGADVVHSRTADLATAVGKDCVDVVIDLVGGTTWPVLLDVLRHGGRYACSGAIAGPIVELDLRVLYFKDLSLLGCTNFEPNVFDELVDNIEQSTLTPLIASVFSMRDIANAQKAFVAKDHVGKIVLDLNL